MSNSTTLAELKRRLAAAEAATAAAPRAMQVHRSMIRQGEPTPTPPVGTTLHLVDVIVRPSFMEDASLPERAAETVTIDPGPVKAPPAPRAALSQMPFLRGR